MPRRRAAFALLLAVPVLFVTACAPVTSPPAATPTNSAVAGPTASATPTPTPTPTATAAALPADTVLQVTATATSSTGAVLLLTATVLRPRIYTDPIAAPRAAATVARCVGEVDNTLIHQQKWSFAEVDYSATLAAGSSAWPKSLSMLLAPWANGGIETRTAASGVKQIEYTGSAPGDYEPECVQRAFLAGPGSGKLYLGAGDSTNNPPFENWSKEGYGFDFNLPKKVVPAGLVTISNCTSTITPLGNSLGAPNSSWATLSGAVECVVGDPETQNKPHT